MPHSCCSLKHWHDLCNLSRSMGRRIRSRRSFMGSLIRATRLPFSFLGLLAVVGCFIPRILPQEYQLEAHAGSAALFLLWAAAGFGAWGLFEIIGLSETRLLAKAKASSSRLDDFFYAFSGIVLRGLIPLLLLLCIYDPLIFPVNFRYWVEKIPPLTIIFAIGWILCRTAAVSERVVLSGMEVSPDLESRGLITRIRLLRRIAVVIIGLFTVASALMIFEPLRHLGTSLLASAGVLGIVLGLAAQRTFGNLFAGVQIAFSQPIRIGDQLKIEGEVGVVEEITLTYVVVKLWDLRRLMLPISYFIENPFQNWTRTSTNIIGTVMIYVDFTAPVAVLRDRFRSIVESSSHWNRNTCALHVTSCDDVCMQLRLIASAPTAGESFELQCEIREKMLDCLRREFPQALPRARNEQKSVETWDQAINWN